LLRLWSPPIPTPRRHSTTVLGAVGMTATFLVLASISLSALRGARCVLGLAVLGWSAQELLEAGCGPSARLSVFRESDAAVRDDGDDRARVGLELVGAACVGKRADNVGTVVDEFGISADSVDRKFPPAGRTVLHRCAEAGCAECCRHLVGVVGADPRITDDSGLIPFDVAVDVDVAVELVVMPTSTDVQYCTHNPTTTFGRPKDADRNEWSFSRE